MDVLRHTFRPEFLNRVDETLVFKSLGKGEIERIVEIQLRDLRTRLAERKLLLEVSPEAKAMLAEVTESTWGGRKELAGPAGIIDYVSLIWIAIERSKTAREAIRTMASQVEEHGYASTGESFSISDPNEVWLMEMIGPCASARPGYGACSAAPRPRCASRST